MNPTEPPSEQRSVPAVTRSAADIMFPTGLHVLTYDLHGVESRTGIPRQTRQTGLVTHTHQLLAALAREHPQCRLAVCYTGVRSPSCSWLRTPEGHLALAHGIPTHFPELAGPGGSKNPQRVQHFYETTLRDPNNPVWRRLAQHYAEAVGNAGIRSVLTQNINPLVSLLKATEFGLLEPETVQVTGVIHDTEGMPARLDYVREHLVRGRVSLRVVAVSTAIREALVEAGIPAEAVYTVPNGLGEHFLDQVGTARRTGAFERVRARNGLPRQGRMVLTSARRVAWKGHLDVLEAVEQLVEQRRDQGWFVAFNGAGLCDSREPEYEAELARQVRERGLPVYLLDTLDETELAACYAQAHVAVHPSRRPEPFGYANIEAMLAGVPVIAAAHGGPLEYVTHGETGCLVPPSNPAALAVELHRLLSDPVLHRHLSRQGHERARAYTLTGMWRGYEAALASHTAHTTGVRA